MWVASPYLQHQSNEHRDGVKETQKCPPPYVTHKCSMSESSAPPALEEPSAARRKCCCRDGFKEDYSVCVCVAALAPRLRLNESLKDGEFFFKTLDRFIQFTYDQNCCSQRFTQIPICILPNLSLHHPLRYGRGAAEGGRGLERGGSQDEARVDEGEVRTLTPTLTVRTREKT